MCHFAEKGKYCTSFEAGYYKKKIVLKHFQTAFIANSQLKTI